MELQPEQLQKIDAVVSKIHSQLNDPRVQEIIEKEGRDHVIFKALEIHLQKNPEDSVIREHLLDRFFPKKEGTLEKNKEKIDSLLTAVQRKLEGKNPEERDEYMRETVMRTPSFVGAPMEVQTYLEKQFLEKGWLKEPVPDDAYGDLRGTFNQIKDHLFTLDETKNFGIKGLVDIAFPDFSSMDRENQNFVIHTVTSHYEELLKGPEFNSLDDRTKSLLKQQFGEWKAFINPTATPTPPLNSERREPSFERKEPQWGITDAGAVKFLIEAPGGTSREINRSIFTGGPYIDTPEKKADLVQFLNDAERSLMGTNTLRFDFSQNKAKIRLPSSTVFIETPLLYSDDQLELLQKFDKREPLNPDEVKRALTMRDELYTFLKDQAMSRMVKDFLREKYGIFIDAPAPTPPLAEPILPPVEPIVPIIEPVVESPIPVVDAHIEEEEEKPKLTEPKSLDELRQEFVKAEGEWKQFEGPLGFLLGKLQGEKREEMERILDEARSAYEEARAEYVLGDLNRYLEEENAVLNERIDEVITFKERQIGRALREFFEKHKKARFLISAGLLGIGFAIPALAIPALAARRVLGGAAAGFGTFNLIQAWRHGREQKRMDAFRKDVEENEDALYDFDEEGILGKILEMRSYAIAHGVSLEGDELYGKLIERWKSILIFERGPFSEKELAERNREAESLLEEFRRKNKTADDIAVITGVGVGLVAGSGILAQGIKNLFSGTHTSGAGALQAAAAAGRSATTSAAEGMSVQSQGGVATESVSPTAIKNIVAEESLKKFDASHALLKEQGLQSTIRDGHVSLEAHLGKHGIPKHLDQLLRRMVVDEMDLGGKKTFDALDAARAENALANFRELLKGNSVLGISPDDVKSFAHFDGKTLNITDYDAYQKFMQEKLLSHAREVITPESGTVKEALKTPHTAWENMLEVKNKEIEVQDFAPRVENSPPVSEVPATETPALESVTPEVAETSAPASSSESITPEIGEMEIREVEGPATGSSGIIEEIPSSSPEAFASLFEDLNSGKIDLEMFANAAAEHTREFSQFFLQRAKEYGVSFIATTDGKEFPLDEGQLFGAVTDPISGAKNIKALLAAFQSDARGLINIPLTFNGREVIFEFRK
ncbi:MAG: hypothetical protein Q7R79_01280 [bacterium]|nr:hypothetical protein [bacterium]